MQGKKRETCRKLFVRRGRKTGKGGELGKKTTGTVTESELHKKWTERG